VIKYLHFLAAFLLLQFSVNAQVVLPPDLQCVANDNVNGNVTLYWTVPNNTCGAFIDYTVFASVNQAGPYSPIATVVTQSQSSFIHVNALATSQTWYYYVVSNYNCPGATVVASDTVNNLNPNIPQIINATVQNGQAVLNWEQSTSPQTFGYVIYYFLDNGNALPIDTVYGINFTTYTDVVGGDPTAQSLRYTIAAFDSCFRFSSYSTLPHNTILANYSATACASDVDLAWNRYHNFPQNVKEYKIWASVNQAPFAEVGTTDSTTFQFSFSGFTDGDTMCLYIQAVSAEDSNIVANSNEMCLRASIVKSPDFIFITNATVNSSNQNEVTWMIDTTAELIFYKVDRSVNDVTYQPNEQIAVPSPLTYFTTHIDSEDVRPDLNPYYYTVTSFDSCQNQLKTSAVKTINLTGELFDYYLADIAWNDFELEFATVTKYNIYRNFGNGYQLIHVALPGTNNYSDTLRQFLQERGVFCYKVEAEYNLNLPNGYNANLTSFSNELCIIHRPIIYIPTAFAPDGLNNVFKPTIIYGEPQTYSMTIFNRWGGLVFESTDPNVGWDGSDRGKPAQQGGYAYIILFTAADGIRVERKGMVLLVK
jgi:gliding motility-associated-like protein